MSQRRFELACAFFIFAEKGQDAVDARDLSGSPLPETWNEASEFFSLEMDAWKYDPASYWVSGALAVSFREGMDPVKPIQLEWWYRIGWT